MENVHFNKIKLIHFIKGLVLVLFISVLYYSLNSIFKYEALNSNGEVYFDKDTLFNALIHTKWLRPVILLAIPLMGIFLNNRNGWLLITTYFYMITIGVLFTFFESTSLSIVDILIEIVFFIFAVSIILAMNMRRIFEKYYLQLRKTKFKQNTITLGFGMLIWIILKYY